MPESMSVTVVGSIPGETSSFTKVFTATADNMRRSTPTVPLAKAGTLTTRTNATTGTFTMSSGHGITTASVVDVFWSGGARYNVTVGTVATNSVPFSGGSGDDLPVATTVIAAMVPHVEADLFDGDEVTGFMASCTQAGFVHYCKSDDTIVYSTTGFTVAAGADSWVDGMSTNPLAGADIEKIKFSHGQTVTAPTMRSRVLVD